MSIRVQIDVSDYTNTELAAAAAALADGAALHNRIATDAEIFVKKAGAEIAAGANNHKSAARLGATQTGHLAQAYAGIESVSDASSACLLVPRASRLRAAFGQYVLTPTGGRKYLTIPVAAEAYGKRAGEIDDLFFMRVGPRGTPVLARRVEGEKSLNLRNRPGQRRQSRRFTQAEILYVLVKKATIPENTDLIPFAELENEARRSAGDYIDDALEASLT